MKRRIFLPIVDHVLAAALLLIVSGFWMGQPVWRAGNPLLLLVGIFAAAYFVCGLAIAWLRPREGRTPLLHVVLAGVAAFGIAFMAVEFAEWRWPDHFAGEMPRPVPFVNLALGLASLVVLSWAHDSLGGRLQAIVPVLLAIAIAGTLFAQAGTRRAQSQVISHLDSSLYVLKQTTYRRWAADRARGGAIAPFDEGYLVATGGGAMYFARESDDRNSLAAQALAYRVPINREEFARGGRRKFGEAWTDHYHRERLRVADLVVQPRPGGSYRVFVSHHVWKPTEECYAVQVSLLEGSRDDVLAADAKLAWRAVYESTPCLTFNTGGLRGAWFGGYQIGGAMALLGEDELLVAVGDHEFDGWNRTPVLPQDAASPYGKLMLVRLDTGEAEVYSLGHRNPQGLYVDPAGTVWSTEHGPRGGDELNLVQRGANYGWPLVTYGTEYWLRHWPMNEAAGRHDGFEKPVLAFVPSIALSAMTGIAGEVFDSWQGDLMLVSLSGELRRVRIEDGRAIVVEPLTVEDRIRDVTQGRDGRIALLTDAQDLIFLEPADDASPEALVLQCAGCHTFNRRENVSIGPNLWQIVGRRVGADDEFEYSEAMLKFGGRWSRKRLDQFLADPMGTVPGTTMQFDGITDAAQRERLIEFLEELR